MDRSKSNLRTLLRGHSKRISDVSFFNNQPNRNDIVGTVAGREWNSSGDEEDDVANVLIWRIYKREDELASEKILEIRLKDAVRLVWHPFNPNQFVLLHNNHPNSNTNNEENDAASNVSKKQYCVVATFVETTRLMTVQHETEVHAVFSCPKPDEIDGGLLKLVCFGPASQVGIHDLSWSNQDARHVITAHKDGTVKLWDSQETVFLDIQTGDEVDESVMKRLQQKENPNAQNSGNSIIFDKENFIESAKCIMTLNVNIGKETGADCEVQKCIFLPSFEDATYTSKPAQSERSNITSPFLTVTNRGKCVSLWAPFTSTGSPPTIIRSFELGGCPAETEFNVSVSTVANGVTSENPTVPSLPSSFIMFADKSRGDIYALHLNSMSCESSSSVNSRIIAVNGFDYVIPFRTTQPIYSWATMVSAISDNEDNAEPDEDGWKIDLYCVQSKSVQLLSLTKTMLTTSKPIEIDEDNLPDGLTVEHLNTTPSVMSDDVAENIGELSYEDEEYEIENVEDIEYEEYDDEDLGDEGNVNSSLREEKPEESNEDGEKDGLDNIPAPNQSSFANWLGNLAGVVPTPNIPTIPASEKKEPTIPPTPQVVPVHKPVSIDLSNVPLPIVQSTDTAQKNIVIDMPDISTVPLPVAPDIEKSDTIIIDKAILSIEKPKAAQRYLSPMEMIEAINKEAVQAPVVEKKPQFTSVKAEKKESKKKSTQKAKNTQPVPIPTKDGKIAILKREDAGKPTIQEKPPTVATSSSDGVTKEEVEDIVRKAISGHFQRQENVITAEIQKAVRYEVQSGLVPTLNKTVSQTLDQTISKTMKSAVSKSVKESTKINTDELATDIASKLKDPLVDSFYKSMRELMIPAFEAGTRQMFEQISDSVEKGLEMKKKSKDKDAKSLEEMSKRMDAMAKTMEVLIQGVAQMTSGSNVTSAPAASNASPVVDNTEFLKAKIGEIIMAGDFEKAFTSALGVGDPDMAVWTCQNSDLSMVLESEIPKLSQPIMLCLMQQLGADFSPEKDGDLEVKIAWLQSLALTLNPSNNNIKNHITSVSQQLITNLQKKIAEPSVTFRREMQMLIQVIRGIGFV
jgi:enhancer of mRNA-decapping protein 4